MQPSEAPNLRFWPASSISLGLLRGVTQIWLSFLRTRNLVNAGLRRLVWTYREASWNIDAEAKAFVEALGGLT